MGPSGFRHGNRPDNWELASPRVAPNRPSERHGRELQPPAAAPDRNAGGKGGTGEINLPGDEGRPIIDMKRRAGEHHTVEVRERGAKRQGLAIGDIEESTADVPVMQLDGRGEERKV